MDGVLTDGSLWMADSGELVIPFNVKDGYAIVYARKHGLEVGIITGRTSQSLAKRAQDLHITELHQGIHDKLIVFQQILEKKQLTAQQVAYMGDDIPDIPVLKNVSYSTAPYDASVEVKKIVQYVSPYKGGQGAVRDVIERILQTQNNWPPKI